MQYKIIVDKQPSSNPSSEKKEYIIDIEELRVKGDVYDSLNIEMNRTYVTRRLSLSEYGVLTVLDEPIIQELTEVNIELFEGDNYIYLSDMQGNKFYAEYLIKNDFNDIYATKNEMNSAITQTAQSIEFSVNQKLTGYSTTQEMNSAIQQTAQNITSSVNQTLMNYATNDELEDEVTELNSTITQTASSINSQVSQKVGKNEVISSINQSAEAVQINANKINLDGKQINLTSDNISISSNNFNVDTNGNMSCNNATMNNAIIDGGSIKLVDTSGIGDEFQITSDTYKLMVGASLFRMGDINSASEKFIGMDTSEGAEPIIMVSNGGNTTSFIEGSGIRTPKLTQTSLESIKKNISKFTKNATDIINNSDIYEYNLKSDKDEDEKLIGFVIGNNYKTPNEVIDKNGQAVSLYSAIGILWKGFQERQAKINKLEEIVEQLEKEVHK